MDGGEAVSGVGFWRREEVNEDRDVNYQTKEKGIGRCLVEPLHRSIYHSKVNLQ